MFVVPRNTPYDYLEREEVAFCVVYLVATTIAHKIPTTELLNIDTIYRIMCTNYIQFS